MSSWVLENVEVAREANPDRFFIPSLEERKSKVVGDLVKLHFVLTEQVGNAPRAERMWVEITERTENDLEYVGVLTNNPAYIKDLSPGDLVRFGSQHIAQVYVSRDDPGWFAEAELSAIVSKQILETENFAGWMYREKPEDERDSGWRIFSGLETDEYLDNFDNASVVNIGWLVEYDPSLAEVIQAEIGSAFERRSREEDWEYVEDWSL